MSWKAPKAGSGGSPNRHAEMPLAKKATHFIRKPLSHKTHFAGRFGATYFITICCHERFRNQLCHEETTQAIFRTASLYDHQQRWYLKLLLLMPDHLHALISIGGDASLSSLIGDFKRATARFGGIKWQRNFFDHRLRDDKSLGAKAIYIRQNPVRAGLIEEGSEWLFVLDRDALDVAVR